jgi:transcriptional regulator with XRE-family HTH domain
MKEYPYLSQAIGNAIEIFRKNKKMTKFCLAEFAWLERRYLREIELGDKKPTVNAVYSICEALDVPPLEFFKKVEEEIARLKAEMGKLTQI